MTSGNDERRVLCEEEIEVSLFPGLPPRRYKLRMILDPNPKPRRITGVLPDSYLT